MAYLMTYDTVYLMPPIVLLSSALMMSSHLYMRTSPVVFLALVLGLHG